MFVILEVVNNNSGNSIFFRTFDCWIIMLIEVEKFHRKNHGRERNIKKLDPFCYCRFFLKKKNIERDRNFYDTYRRNINNSIGIITLRSGGVDGNAPFYFSMPSWTQREKKGVGQRNRRFRKSRTDQERGLLGTIKNREYM